MSKSVKRVAAALENFNLDVSIQQMPDSTRTAQEAATACGCTVGQIVKSMIFEGSNMGLLKLLLVSGKHQVDMDKAPQIFGEPLVRADPKRIRTETGFAIGGVSPIGHLSNIETWIDKALLEFDVVWAAAGAPNAVFKVSPQDLKNITKAKVF